MFNQILAVFQGFLSRAFWFGNFLPVVIVAALHIGLAAIQFPEAGLLAKFVDNPTALAVAFVSLVVLAYALAPLIPLFRDILDGRLLWTWLNDELRRERVIEARRIIGEFAEAGQLAGEFDWFSRNQRDWFDQASRRGDDPGRREWRNIVLGTPFDETAIRTAEQAVAALRWQVEAARLPSTTLGQDAFTKLAQALERNPGNTRLVNCRSELEKLFADATSEIQHRWVALVKRYKERFELENPAATRIGDARQLTERYSLNAYQVDFDYIWPRLQLVLPDQNPFRDQLVASKAQLDFAILSLVLILTLPLVWLPWLAWTAGSPWLFLVVGVATPFVVSFFYRLSVEAQFGFGDTLKTAIDRYRLDLLKILRQPVPPNLSTERALWQQLDGATRGGAPIDLSYRHPPS
jgi:hypothetical protein